MAVVRELTTYTLLLYAAYPHLPIPTCKLMLLYSCLSEYCVICTAM